MPLWYFMPWGQTPTQFLCHENKSQEMVSKNIEFLFLKLKKMCMGGVQPLRGKAKASNFNNKIISFLNNWLPWGNNLSF